MRKRLLRLLPLAPLAMLLLASPAMAQTTGTIIGVVTDASTGKPVAGAVIIARSPNLQGEQTAVTDEKGSYRLPQLPPGQYTLAVQLAGYRPSERSDIVLRLDKTIRANLAVTPEAVQLEEQQVRTGVAPVINVGSAESGAVLTKEFLATVPVGRTFEAAAVAAPTAQADQYGVGFAGAQSPENNYILDGLNVTDPRFGTNGVSLLNNFVQEIDVKTGSFMPEYGRATGGILNIITKSGSNELHGSIFGNWTPGQLSPAGKETGRAGEAIGFRRASGEGGYHADFGLDLGGPIVKDKLWFYAGFAPVLDRQTFQRWYRQANNVDAGFPVAEPSGGYSQTEIPGTRRKVTLDNRGYQGNAKLTYLLNENNNITVSGFANPGSNNLVSFNSADSRRTLGSDTRAYDLIGRYSGKFLDKRLILEAVGGWHRQSEANTPKTIAGVDQAATPEIRWNLPGSPLSINNFADVPTGYCTTPGQCLVDQYTTGGYGFYESLTLNRFAGRVAASYLVGLFGSHNWKAGADYERTNYDHQKHYSGLAFYDFNASGRFRMNRSYGVVLDPSAPTEAGVQFQNTASTLSRSNSTAIFLQDSWQVANSGLTINGGVRWEFQDMLNQREPTTPHLRINDNIAPRVQAIYDFTGTGRSKIAANWGRFYENIPLDMGDRAFSIESQINARYTATVRGSNPPASACAGLPLSPRDPNFRAPAAFNPRTACPLAQNVLTDPSGTPVNWLATASTVTPLAPDLKGMYVDQFGGSAEYELFQDFSIGVEYLGRRLGRVIEDMSSNDGNTYFIGNPAESKPYTFQGEIQNPRVVSTLDPYTGRALQVAFPKPERQYDGVTFKAAKNLSNNWLAQVSYTYSVLQGNYAGLYRSEDGQLDPNITSEYDLPTLMTNKKGLLPGDSTHQVKLFGAYVFNFGQKLNVTTGGAVNARSGAPVNALGSHPIYGDGQAWLIERGTAGRTPFVTSFDLSGKAQYKLSGPYAVQFSVDVFNLFNSQEVLNVDENYTFDDVLPIVGAKCKSKSSIGKSNPIAAIQADCPDLAYAKTVAGNPVSVNANFGRPLANLTTAPAFQVPISFRFGLALTF